MHNLHAFKVHVSKEELDKQYTPHQVAMGMVYSFLDNLQEEVETDEDGHEYSMAPFDYFSMCGAIDINTELAELEIDGLSVTMGGDSRSEAWMQWWGRSFESLIKCFNNKLTLQELRDGDTELYGGEYTECGLTNINCTPEDLPTHIVLVDFHS